MGAGRGHPPVAAQSIRGLARMHGHMGRLGPSLGRYMPRSAGPRALGGRRGREGVGSDARLHGSGDTERVFGRWQIALGMSAQPIAATACASRNAGPGLCRGHCMAQCHGAWENHAWTRDLCTVSCMHWALESAFGFCVCVCGFSQFTLYCSIF